MGYWVSKWQIRSDERGENILKSNEEKEKRSVRREEKDSVKYSTLEILWICGSEFTLYVNYVNLLKKVKSSYYFM